MSATAVKSPPSCRRCGNPLYTGGSRGLCLPCLSATTIARFSSSEGDSAGDDLRLEEGLAVGPNGRFLLHDKLGAGGMGEVWLATDQELSREDEPYWVALKFLSESIRGNKNALAAVRTEVIRSQELNHHNIVRVFDLHTTRKGMPFIKMEYVKGNSLSYWLQDCPNGVMRWKDVVDIGLQLCGALQYAHETAGVIHRDIKPGNILLRTDRILKLTDFGIAEALYTTRAAALKKTGLGTLWYASPQQISGQRPMPADDIHAVGATLYELLTGTPPFLGDVQNVEGDSTEVLIHQVRYDPPEPLRQRMAKRNIYNEIPPRLADLIYRCLEKEPQKRPLAREILAQLQAINPTSASEPSPESVVATQQIPQIPAETWESAPIPEPPTSVGRRILMIVGPILTALLAVAAIVAVLYAIPATQPWIFKVAQAAGWKIKPPETPVGAEPHRREVRAEESAKPAEPETPPVVPAVAPPEKTEFMGRLQVNFAQLVRERPNVSRRLVVQRLDGQAVLNEPSPRREFSFSTPDLPEGDYNVSIVELPGEWRATASAHVSRNNTTTVPITTATVFFTIKVEPPDASLSWGEGIADQKSSRGEYRSSFRIGSFPIYASKPGYVHDPDPEIVHITAGKGGVEASQKIVLRAVRYPMLGRGSWNNSLGMTFKEFKSFWVSTAETRVGDFRTFCAAEKYDATKGMYSVTPEGYKQIGRSWIDPGPLFRQNQESPVVGVNWTDADAFCKWLTKKDRTDGFIKTNQTYRLPTSEEWFQLAEGENHDKFPWGPSERTLREGQAIGNYSGLEVAKDPEWPAAWPYLRNYTDGFPRTAPAGPPFIARNGFFHLGGNAAEWTDDKVLCGGSWADGEENHLDCLQTRVVSYTPPEERHDRNGFRVLLETKN